jgi:hypothetical protein
VVDWQPAASGSAHRVGRRGVPRSRDTEQIATRPASRATLLEHDWAMERYPWSPG